MTKWTQDIIIAAAIAASVLGWIGAVSAPTLALFSSFDRSHLAIFVLLCWPWLWSDVGKRAAVVCLAAHLDALRFKDPRQIVVFRKRFALVYG